LFTIFKGTYSTVKSAGHATYGLIDKGSSVLLFPFTNQSAETKDDASGKTVTEGSRYQTVVDGASSTVKGTASSKCHLDILQRLCYLDLYQGCSNYSPRVKIGLTLGIIDYHYVNIVKS
jgi:hypothetical protein